MAKKLYEHEAQYLADATTIAIDVLKANRPQEWEKEQIDLVINFYIDCRERILNPLPEYANLRSLKYLQQDVFTLFQESSLPFVAPFWEKIKEKNLPYKRENRLAKILKKGKIINRQEYDYVVDTIVPFRQQQLITEEEATLLNKYIGNFEERSNYGKYL